MAPLSGPRLPPTKGAATQLVVLLHGYGADGDDLIGLAPHWQNLLPGAAFVAPHAPDRVPGAPSGFQWFPISRIDPHEMQKGVTEAAPRIESFEHRRVVAQSREVVGQRPAVSTSGLKRVSSGWTLKARPGAPEEASSLANLLVKAPPA